MIGAPPPAATADDRPTVVLGIGNVLWADEGFGVRCVEALQQRFELAPAAELIDGGTQGIYLVQHVQRAGRLLIFDAIDYGLAPGTLRVIRGDDVPAFLGAKKMSLHQTGFQEVLALARLTGRHPDELVLVGCQPEELDDYGGSLRPVVRAAIAPALDVAVDLLTQWGHRVTPRRQPLADQDAVTLPSLALARYEHGRPAAEDACRIGDARFLAAPPAG